MSKYVVKRKDVCAGTLFKKADILYYTDSAGNKIKETKSAKGETNYVALPCRGMLFNVDDYGLANDLIYTTLVNYPINGIATDQDIDTNFIIDHYVELDELLKYLKYGVDLTQNDLKQIYRKLIAHKWWLEHNMELFGWKRIPYGLGYTASNDGVISMDIYSKLCSIDAYPNGKPSSDEPYYSLIKMRK